MDKKICPNCKYPNDLNNKYCVQCSLPFKTKKKVPKKLIYLFAGVIASMILSETILLKTSYENDKVINYKQSILEVIKLGRGMDKDDTITLNFPNNDLTDKNGNLIGTDIPAPIKGYIRVKVDDSVEFKLFDGNICGIKSFDEKEATLTYGECQTYEIN